MWKKYWLLTQCSFINIKVNKVAKRAIVDLGAPGNIISTKLVKKLGLLLDIAHKEVFGTAGPASKIPLKHIVLSLFVLGVNKNLCRNYFGEFKL